MNKIHFTAIITAALMSVSMCSCLEKKEDTSNKPVPSATEASAEGTTSAPPVPVSPLTEKIEYKSGNYISESFSLYAEPNIWQYDDSASVKDCGALSCDLKMVTDRDFTTCGLKVYTAENKSGISAQETINAENSTAIFFTGSLATGKYNFYYYEWAANDNMHCRSYLADFGDKYLCAYAESSNFGYVESKIADVLQSIKSK
jgi:hypothetical protein